MFKNIAIIVGLLVSSATQASPYNNYGRYQQPQSLYQGQGSVKTFVCQVYSEYVKPGVNPTHLFPEKTCEITVENSKNGNSKAFELCQKALELFVSFKPEGKRQFYISSSYVHEYGKVGQVDCY